MPTIRMSRLAAAAAALAIACGASIGCASARAASASPVPKWPDRFLPASGDVAVPVLLVRFRDSLRPAALPAPSAVADHLFAVTGASRSLADYYREVSYGELRLEGEVHGWFDIPREHLFYYYSAECAGICEEADPRIAIMVEKAVERATAAGTDWLRYDNDRDGFVDLVVVAPAERARGCPDGAPGINPHAQQIWNLRRPGRYVDTGARLPDGRPVVVNQFVVAAARDCDADLPSVGDWAHEIGHALALPDLVDQDHSSGGIGTWSLMADGGFGGDGFSPNLPTHLSAWAKERLGWLVPRQLAAGDRDVLRPVETHREAIRLPIDDDGDPSTPSSRYDLLEVRSRTGFDRGLPGVGLLVWRIDGVVVDEWDARRRALAGPRSVNDLDDRKGVLLLEADGLAELASQTWHPTCECFAPRGCTDPCGLCCARREDADDPFPGSGSATRFDSRSTPPNLSGIALCDIALIGDEVHFRIDRDGTCN